MKPLGSEYNRNVDLRYVDQGDVQDLALPSRFGSAGGKRKARRAQKRRARRADKALCQE